MKKVLITSAFAVLFSLGVSATEKPDVASELKSARTKLAELRETYSDKHPKVKQQAERVQSLEKKQPVTK